ncbi:aminotransferase class IV [Georgenia satyanarayanai]|uniref:aminotransferase class IV n=1 Tax=Georgenia satyanarayanai TaxID=860221 RepID=UPI00203F671D|nr:aminotransferase class IV [Georgenia satyanarayanai]MCM3660111.1 aminotransferase class IV [Georgenia satyanarayanai]
MSTLVWFDGEVRPAEEPVVTALDRGLTVGDGVFDTCVVVSGRPFALRRHVARLVRSATTAGLPLPPVDVVTSAALDLAARLEGGSGRLRMTWTAGPLPAGTSRADATPTLLLTASAERVPHPGADGPRPRTAVVVVPWVRNERSPLVGVKSTSYGENVLALEHARRQGGTEAVLANTRDELCEGSASNVFLETGGELLTPPVASGCLAGVTRELVLEWATEAGLPVREAVVPMAEFLAAEYAAVTSATRGIVPVDSIDGRDITPGPVTLRVQELYAARAAEDLDP